MTMDKKDQNELVQKWNSHIASYDREFKKWQGRVEKILKRYRDDTRSTAAVNTAKFNILWSNVQTLTAATFAKLPKPDVSRRFRDNDPIGRIASLILERALDYEIEHYSDYRSTLQAVVSDRFLGGRGTAWVRYEPHMRAADMPQMPEDGLGATEDIDEPYEELDYECVPTDYVHWKDFGHTIARSWEEVTGVWRKVYMTRDALIERFGEEMGSSIPLDASPDQDKKEDNKDMGKRALIYEIWDKESKQALWYSKSLGQFVDIKDDPLELEDFWPCPKPVYATITNDSLVPVPDFALYQDQANELDVLCERIDGLIKALQVRGVYDASVPELARLFSEGANNTLIPVKNWQAFAEKQGLQGAINLVDIAPIATALINAYQAMDQVKAQIYEITGISDIIRGQSDASETATAQNLKGQYASLRLKTAQDAVAIFATDLLKKKAEIICTKFSDDTILKISAAGQLSEHDQALIPQALQLLKDNPLRAFRIDISSDSLVYMDETQEKQDRMEFLSATSQFLEKAIQGAQMAPEITPLLLEMLKFGVAGFKIGKTIEGLFDETAEKIKQAQAEQQANPKPDPEQLKLQAEQQKNAAELQQKAADSQLQAQLKTAEFQQQQQLERERIQMQNQLEIERERMKLESQERIRANEMAHERWKIELETAAKIEVANISAKAKVDDAATQTSTQEIAEEVQQ
jgi:hypothetical protein